jgi:hypothetical protein
MKNKQIKRNWHKQNKNFVYNYFKKICQVCKKSIELGTKWDIHHLQYNYHKKIYETDAKELIEQNIIILICRKCHNEIHTAKDNNNPIHNQFTIENRGICELCNRNEHGIFNRKKCEKLEKLLCRKCYLENKILIKHKIIQIKLF